MPDIDPLLKVKADVDGIHDGDTVMQEYPSPVPNGQDTSNFYRDNGDGANNTGTHEDTATPHPDQQLNLEHQQSEEQPSAPHHDDQVQPQDHQQHDQHQPPSAHPAMTSAEELQLAAQLSQGISQGMPSTLLEPTTTDVDVDDPNLRASMQGPDEPPNHELQHLQDDSLQQEHMQHHHNEHLPPHGHGQPIQGSAQLQNHEHAMQNHDQPVLQQHDGLPYYAEEPQHQFMPVHQQQQQSQQQSLHPSQPVQQHLQPHGPLGHSMQRYGPPISDNTPPRKRSKVSRACDECRRKKVKCDAASENGDEPCSNCRRSSIICLFSRIPQKRGPSKGYIKELADRIHSIEGKLASEGGNVDALSELLNGARRESSDIFSPPGTADENRKRPYSSISTGDFGTPGSSRQTAWGSEPRPIQPFQPQKQSYSANDLAPQPTGKPEADTSSRPAAVMDSLSLDLDHNGAIRELDEGAFTGYINVVHQCYPLLAASKTRVEDRLLQCPPLLKDAFIEALYGTMQSFVSVPGLYTNGDISSASRLITEWESDPSPRSFIMNLVHLQTLILTAIATDNHGPSSLRGEHGGASKASVLGRAVGLAYSMRLHVPRSDEVNSDAELDRDSDENVATRVWWTLIMLDRWNAISTSSPLLIPNDSVVIIPSLSTLLGEDVYHLARLSNILGHFAPVSLAPPKTLTPASGVAPIISSFFNLSIELFREVLPATIEPTTFPILHLVYWHSRLLAYLFQTNSKSTDILWPCKESVGLLLSNAQVLSPLNHHFLCLTTLSLLELVKVDATREEANRLLKELLDSNHAPSTWDGVIRDRINERLRPDAPQAETASQGLQHLADLATATEAESAKPEQDVGTSLRMSDNYDDIGFDPRALTRGGYLNVLAEPRPVVAR